MAQEQAAPALSAHDAAMVAVVDAKAAEMAAEAGGPPATPVAASTPPARPEGVPEKFWDATTGTVKTDDLIKSYAELERTRVAPAAAVTSPAVVPPVTKTPEEVAAEAALEAAKTPEVRAAEAAALVAAAKPAAVDLATYSAEYAASGALSEASYSALEAGGYPKALVDQFIAGQQATITAHRAAVFASAGGEAEYTAMAAWAGANLTPAEIAAFDSSVSSPNAALAAQAVTALKARFVEANGVDPKLIEGGGPDVGGGAFASRAEVVAAMSDPRYKKDPAYRAMVSRRIDGMASF
ncbi:hypothetical protein GNX71_18565 [Variovorax sp. RKNM96]|uniref:capsid assembly protein n=1 Tax=Variovorax sp. RKNM96 TaxID=2681552 RepID=UPI001980C36D|nr:hypothetical protein [Variovorax sp. RKNM96]QSI31472.1 hypothetical protein GNX71_18565 [Variovorax sp. RKNM96]